MMGATMRKPTETRKNPITGAVETVGYHPYRLFYQAHEIRTVVSRNDFTLKPNPDYHQPIAYQDGKFFSFVDTCDGPELDAADVPAYIRTAVAKTPTIPMREVREVTITAAELQAYAEGRIQAEAAAEKPAKAQPARKPRRRRRARRRAPARTQAAPPAAPEPEATPA